MSPAEELRAAAARIRGRAEKATPGPWRAEPDTHAGRVWVQRGRTRDGADCEPLFNVRGGESYAQRAADAEHIATWSPEPALAVAAWLEQTADRHGEDDAGVHSRLCLSAPAGQATVCPDMAAALVAARAISGGAS